MRYRFIGFLAFDEHTFRRFDSSFDSEQRVSGNLLCTLQCAGIKAAHRPLTMPDCENILSSPSDD
jgi:hypothetical protein